MEDNSIEEISLKELIQTILNQKYLIISFTLASIIIAIAVSGYMLDNSKKAELIVSLNFEGIETHINPDGSEFNESQIVTPAILNEVIKDLKLENVSTSDILLLITLESIIPNEVEDLKKYTLEKEGTSYIYYPKDYILSVETNKGLNINEYKAKSIANEIVNQYIEEFQNKYIELQPIVYIENTFDMDVYDYADISSVFHKKVDELVLYNNRLKNLDNSFRSDKTGLSFNDLVEMSSLIDEVDLNKLDSMISGYKLTKDEEKLIVYYKYIVEQLEINKEEYSTQTAVTKEMLQAIEDTSAESLLGLTKAEEKTEAYFNKLILNTFNSNNSALTIQEQIAYYNDQISDLSSEEITVTKNIEYIKDKGENLINKINKNIGYWITITNMTSQEYYKLEYSRDIMKLSPPVMYKDNKFYLNIAIGAVLGIMIGIFFAFFKSYWKSEEVQV